MMQSEGALSLARYWVANDHNPITRGEIATLLAANDEQALRNLMIPRIAFGTAGLRGRMAPGYAAINDLTVLQTILGLIEYLRASFPDPKTPLPAVVIGFDHRAELAYGISSRKLAALAAAVLIEADFHVHFFNGFVVTPIVPFAVRRLKAACGIMFTASHNPKIYNGMKIYGSNGCLIISPTDTHISDAISRNLTVIKRPSDFVLSANPLAAPPTKCSDPSVEIFAAYNAAIAAMAVCLQPRNADAVAAAIPGGEEKKTTLRMHQPPSRIVHTAMHGVATPFILDAFTAAGLPAPHVVAIQASPDPEFPSVAFPNPEEGARVLQHAFAAAEAVNATIVIASDPDGDRMAVAEHIQATGKWHVFSGNEIGILLADFLHPNATAEAEAEAKSKQQHPGQIELVALNTLVSSRMLGAWAKHVSTPKVLTRVEITPTGFKNLGNRVVLLNNTGCGAESKDRLCAFFAYEEAIGYMCDPLNTSDKDGVSAAVCMAILASQNGGSPFARMQKLYLDVGYFCQKNGYVSTDHCHGGIQASVFARLASYDGRCALPAKLGLRRVLKAERAELDMFIFEIECVSARPKEVTLGVCNLILRSSGTEPKLKYYAELQVNWVGDAATADAKKFAVMNEIADSVLGEIVADCRATWLDLSGL